jgi:rhodanese-related sulfurtransferase
MSVFNRVPTVDPSAAHQRDRAIPLIDVREPDEWAAGHAPDAVHIPLGELRVDALPPGETFYMICRSGNRSGVAAKALIKAGVDAVNVAGGMIAWQRAGLPVD